MIKGLRLWIGISLVSLLVIILLGSNVLGVVESGANYRIECSPDVAFPQANGFTQYCSYLWNGSMNITRDVAFCFGSSLNSAKVLYNGVTDVTNLFKFKKYNMDKGYCYYVEDVTWTTNETKYLRISYMPSNPYLSKWDTYFGDVSSNRIDLKLDPFFNSTHYEIGTGTGSSYYWRTYNIDVVLNNSDINSSTVNFVNEGITTFNRSDISFSYYDGSIHSLGSNPTTATYIFNITTNMSYNVRLNWSVGCSVNNEGVWQTFYYYDGTSSSNYGQTPACGILTWFIANATSGKAVKYIQFQRAGADMLAGFDYVDELNITGYYNYSGLSNASLFSNNISLGNNALSVRVLANYSGVANISLTLDGDSSHFVTLNLSNSSWFNVSTPIASNNKLLYRLDLGANTTIYNLTMDFDSPDYVVTADTLLADSLAVINYSVNVSNGVSSFFSNCSSRFCNTSVAYGTYNVSIFGVNTSMNCSYLNVLVDSDYSLSQCLLFDAVLNVSATNWTGGSVSSFNVSLAGRSYGTTSGSLLAYIVRNYSYSVLFDYPLFASQSVAFTSNSSYYQSLSTMLLPFNALFFQTYLESSGARLESNLTNISVVETSGLAQYSVQTNGSGFAFLQNVSVGSYYVSFDNPSYAVRRVFVNVSNSSSQWVYGYLSNGTAILFNYRDVGGSVIPGVLFELFAFVNGSLTEVGSDLSDPTGRVQFFALENTFYAMNSSKSGYQSYFVSYPQILFTSYDITLYESSTAYITPSAYVSFTPMSFYNGMSNNFSIVFTSPYGYFSSYNFTVSLPSGSLSGSGSTPLGESFNLNFTIPSSTSRQLVVVNYSFLLSNNVSQNVSLSFYTSAPYLNKTLVNMGDRSYGMLLGDKVLWVSVILLIVMGAAFIGAGFEVALVFGGFVLLLLVYNGFIPVFAYPLFYVPMGLIVLYLFFRMWGNR